MERAGKLLHLETAFAAGYTGKGVTAAIIDTGIGATPGITAERVLAFRDFVNLHQIPYDDSGHGTHVAGILAGDTRLACGNFRGVAPECNIVVLKALNEKGDGEIAGVLAALKWVLEQGKEYGIKVLNLSFGAAEKEKKADYMRLIAMVEEVWRNGICVVTAAGNRGPGRGTVTVPGSSRLVITVGAAESGKSYYPYSGRGPTAECILKPDLVAPAAGIISLQPMGWEPGGRIFSLAGERRKRNAGLLDYEEWKKILESRESGRKAASPFLAVKSGTSMATPMVTGSICLLLQKEPGLSPKEIKKRLWQSCVDLGLPPEQQGHGMLDLRLLLQL